VNEWRKPRHPSFVNKISQYLSTRPVPTLQISDLARFLTSPAGTLTASPQAWLRVDGPDAASFLQGQCTQDLRGLKPGQTTPALWLNLKGRIQGESLVLKGPADRWWLWSAHTSGESLRARLEDFVIADDVNVHAEDASWEQITLAGPAVADWLREVLGGQVPPEPGVWVTLGEGLLFAGRRGLPHTWEWLLPAGQTSNAPRPPASLGALSPIALHRARLAAGVAAIPTEFGPQDLPQEAGLESVAISFNKGCYLGQEVMARLHAMGQVRRRLVRVAGPGPAPAATAELRQNEKRFGEIRAVTDDGHDGWFGLALVNLLGLAPSALLTTAEGAAVRLLDLPSP
jgi:folate-binding protein YgfZ